MTPGAMMGYCAIGFVVGLAAVIFNIAAAMKGNLGGGTIIRHLIGGLITGVSGFGVIGGFIWFLVEKLAK